MATLTMDLLPLRAAETALSSDEPSAGAVRPFGLTLGTPLPDGEAVLSLDGLSYDPVRQVNVDALGRVATADPSLPQMGTVYDTQYDHQRFTDKD